MPTHVTQSRKGSRPMHILIVQLDDDAILFSEHLVVEV
jgi:hypothetical protein